MLFTYLGLEALTIIIKGVLKIKNTHDITATIGDNGYKFKENSSSQKRSNNILEKITKTIINLIPGLNLINSIYETSISNNFFKLQKAMKNDIEPMTGDEKKVCNLLNSKGQKSFFVIGLTKFDNSKTIDELELNREVLLYAICKGEKDNKKIYEITTSCDEMLTNKTDYIFKTVYNSKTNELISFYPLPKSTYEKLEKAVEEEKQKEKISSNKEIIENLKREKELILKEQNNNEISKENVKVLKYKNNKNM